MASLVCIALTGCNSTATNSSQSPTPYQTVNPSRHSAKSEASQLNQQALDAIAEERWDEAERLLKQALTADVMHGPAHNNLGRVYFARNELYLAAWEFQYAVKLMPHHIEPRNNLGLVFEAARRFDDAKEQYAAALQLAPKQPEVMGNLARVRVRTGERSDELLGLLEELVMLDPRPTWNRWAREQAIRLRARSDVPAPPASADP